MVRRGSGKRVVVERGRCMGQRVAAHPVAKSVDAVSVVVEPLGGRRRVSGLRSLRCCRLHRRCRHHLCPRLSIKCTRL